MRVPASPGTPAPGSEVSQTWHFSMPGWQRRQLWHSAEGKQSSLPVLALLFLVPLQEGSGELLHAEATFRGQLADGFFHSQVSTAQALTDLAAAIWASRLFLLQPSVCQEVDEAASAHQVPVGALWKRRNKASDSRGIRHGGNRVTQRQVKRIWTRRCQRKTLCCPRPSRKTAPAHGSLQPAELLRQLPAFLQSWRPDRAGRGSGLDQSLPALAPAQTRPIRCVASVIRTDLVCLAREGKGKASSQLPLLLPWFPSIPWESNSPCPEGGCKLPLQPHGTQHNQKQLGRGEQRPPSTSHSGEQEELHQNGGVGRFPCSLYPPAPWDPRGQNVPRLPG